MKKVKTVFRFFSPLINALPDAQIFLVSACLSAPPFPCLEGGHCSLFRLFFLLCNLRLGDALVDLHRRFLPHLVSDMGVGIQRGGAGHMAQDGGQRLNIHSIGQGVGGEGMAQIVI